MKTKKISILLMSFLCIAIASCESDDSDTPCTLRTWYVDLDNDGYGTSDATIESSLPPAGYAAENTDCDDTDASINPGATEIPNDGVDSDCDGEIEFNIWSGPTMTFTKEDMVRPRVRQKINTKLFFII